MSLKQNLLEWLNAIQSESVTTAEFHVGSWNPWHGTDRSSNRNISQNFYIESMKTSNGTYRTRVMDSGKVVYYVDMAGNEVPTTQSIINALIEKANALA